MTKQAFLEELDRLTGALTDEERARLRDYFGEMIDDRMEEGVPEEEAVAAIGRPEDIAGEFAPAAKREERQGGSETVSALRNLRLHMANADVTVVREPLDNGAAAQLRFSDPERFEWRMDGDTLQVAQRRADDEKPGHKFDGQNFARGLEFGLRWLKQIITEPDLRLTVALSEGLAGALDFEGRGSDFRAEGVSFAKARLVTTNGDIALKDVDCAGGIGIELHTHSGDVELTGVRAANLLINAASGDVTGEGVALTGRLRLETASGDVELRNLQCEGANVTTASGDIEIDRGRTGDAAVRTASGDVRLDEVEADPTLGIDTASGDVELSRCIARQTRIKTASGDVELRLEPLPCGYDISANTVSGDVRFGDGCTADASGEAQPRIDIRTVSGDVEAKLAR